ncbi:MAG: hypothetical protein ONB48_06375 [candidate division KSB1 bacterium]|nr:hypothetical protein [candidate division KSB1 bacterium]MDZ7273166.1 hypothetical protein [candidate division KSB1 bacterium]MDZ7285268.1 hypothetical protein [candidate division KSB1 bacterium]MDZ7298300.1 hypothetical protein [candidate division KSB1 bacterium]MDZ7306619.1 hypothetical protein [candidate division KSB1 bacterium]
MTKCLSCHEIGERMSNAKCLTCHVAIARRLQAKRGYHPTVTAAQLSGPASAEQSCGHCHSEHNGVDFELIVWPQGEANFDHRQAGYVLQGRHAKVACRDCHRPENIQEKFADDPNVQLRKTFLGLTPACLPCHGDEHRGQLASQCEQCHDFNGWKPAPHFSHDRAKFQLTGAHRQVACGKCHVEKAAATRVGRETTAAFVQYTGLTFANCTPCHQDPHRGEFGNDCSRCHNTANWKKIAAGAFNHDLTDFPLRGRHQSVACERCHTGGNFKKKIAHAFCRDCHQDAHAGQFARRPDRGGCESCHTVAGFTPSQFTLARHQQTAFPLAGAHLATPCGLCHVRQTAGALAGKLLFVFPEQRCPACHEDVHGGQFAPRVASGGCESCHRNESWRQTTFDHASARFALTGAHQRVACNDCHPREKIVTEMKADATPVRLVRAGPAVTERVRYRPRPLRCQGCHDDVHHGQFGKAEEVRCEKCHKTSQWQDLAFVHNRDSSFKLEGAHARVACERCHLPVRLADRTSVIKYKPIKQECAACHR